MRQFDCEPDLAASSRALATGQGIGSGMLTAIAGFRYAEMWASVVLVTGSSILLYALVGVLESIVLARFGMAPGRR